MMTGKDDRAAAALAAIDERIAWVLESPGMSVWLKSALNVDRRGKGTPLAG
jgi:hypothetical protein